MVARSFHRKKWKGGQRKNLIWKEQSDCVTLSESVKIKWILRHIKLICRNEFPSFELSNMRRNYSKKLLETGMNFFDMKSLESSKIGLDGEGVKLDPSSLESPWRLDSSFKSVEAEKDNLLAGNPQIEGGLKKSLDEISKLQESSRLGIQKTGILENQEVQSDSKSNLEGLLDETQKVSSSCFPEIENEGNLYYWPYEPFGDSDSETELESETVAKVKVEDDCTQSFLFESYLPIEKTEDLKVEPKEEKHLVSDWTTKLLDWSPDSSKPNFPIKEVKLFKFRDEFEKDVVPSVKEKATIAKKFQSWTPIQKLWLNSGWIDVSKVEESFYCTDISPPEIQRKIGGIYDINFIESLSGIEKPFYEAQPPEDNGVEKSSNTLETGWPNIEFSGKSGITNDAKGYKESGMEKSNDDSDFDGKLVILENDDIGNFPTSQTDDYEIDIVDSNGEFEIHMKSLTREEIEADIENMRKQNAEIDIMSLPCVFADNLSLDTAMGLNLNNSETNEPIPTLAIIPPDDNLNEANTLQEGNNRALLEADDGTQFVTEETDNSQIEPSVDQIPPIHAGNQKIENGRKRKYYLCFEAECLFSKRFGRFDTKQKIKRHLYNEHGIRDKIKLEKKATRCQIIIKLAPLPDKIFAETATQTCTGKNDKRLQKKKACHGTAKSAKGKRPEGGSPKKEVKKSRRIKKRKNSSGSESETSESSFQLSSNKKASTESDSQEPSQRSFFVCTQEPCVHLNPQLSFGTQREFRYHVRQHHNKLKTESAKEKSAKVKTENSRKDEPSTSSDADLTNASPPEDENRVYKCESCDTVLNSKRDYNLHAQMHALHDPSTCDICKRTFNSLDQLQAHKEEMHTAKEYKCQACSQEFRFRVHLLQHLRSVHSNDLPMLCPICDKGFLTRSELEIHAVKIHGLTVAFFKCEKCGRAFNNKIGLRVHISNYHKFEEEKPLENALKSGQKKMKKIK